MRQTYRIIRQRYTLNVCWSSNEGVHIPHYKTVNGCWKTTVHHCESKRACLCNACIIIKLNLQYHRINSCVRGQSSLWAQLRGRSSVKCQKICVIWSVRSHRNKAKGSRSTKSQSSVISMHYTDRIFNIRNCLINRSWFFYIDGHIVDN